MLLHNHCTDVSNVLVIDCGGAGIRAAIEVKKAGLSVKVVGKRNKLDAHTVMAAGGINASFANLDKNDSWEQHYADTFLEGYGLGNSQIIETMSREAPSAVREIDEWGANLY